MEKITDLLNKRSDINDKSNSTETSVNQALNFQALIRPNRAQLDQVSQISQLEERLRKLEATIGSSALTLVRNKYIKYIL